VIRKELLRAIGYQEGAQSQNQRLLAWHPMSLGLTVNSAENKIKK
jgi:hypothetical protein